ncbi:flagellar motor protein MotB [Algibacter marinivivus]|uniref:Flagellar motor protein MotB n=1 Tax=Algibacter marinivivus TaxID=2100723 RepID=A0A2U2X4Z8_9FLAO|nr:OmpA family protein [Algibacter marinivivus]PWH82865.1 flagellar motor protein MotB [Algibacter marinivivus]
MKKTIYILSILSALVFNTTNAQKAKASSAIKKYDNLSYIESRNQLLELANKEDASSEVIEKLANAFYFNSEMEDASIWYKKLMDLNLPTEPENLFRYAQSLRAQENYAESDKVLNLFANIRPEDSRVKEFLSKPNYVMSINEMSNDFELLNLDINTAFSDFGTSTYNDHLIFASSRDQDEAIYKWNAQPFLDLFELNEDGSIKEVNGDVNTKYHESSTTFTKDGKTAYFTRNNFFKGKFKKNSENIHGLKIYKATLIDSVWTNIESLPFNNDEYNVAHPALSADEKKLYFASDMFGTQGASDIFVVDINEDGTYSEPLNLGPKVNTEGRENFPFVSDKGILYFSSDGHVGLGGLDVFKIEVDKLSESTTMVHNIGKPINSPKDDFGYIINETSGKGYITSNREGGKGDDDIYSFVVPPCTKAISGTIINKRTQEVLANANVFIYDSSRNLLESLKSDDSGKFAFNLGCKDRTYIIEAKKEKYKDDFTDFSIKEDEKPDLKLELKLEPEAAKIGTDLALLLNLNPIYFDYDKSFIRPDAEIELAKVINYMKEYPNVKIDVRSHTDSRGKDAYNWALSNRRNKSTRAYIIEKGGITEDRLTGQGYGETRLTNRCSNGVKCTKEEHQDNRRSEFIVVAN